MRRLTDPDKWADPWFRRLVPTSKIFFLYLLDRVDWAGVWEKDFELFAFDTGIDICPDALLEDLGDRVVLLDDRRILLPNFVRFQQNDRELSPSNPAHRHIIRLLKKHRLEQTESFLVLPASTLRNGDPSKTLPRGSKAKTLPRGSRAPSSNSKVKVIEKDLNRKGEKRRESEGGEVERMVVDSFHRLCPSFAPVQQITPRRKSSISARTRDGIDFELLFEKAEDSDYLSGRSTQWRADFSWMLKPENAIKILEGVYDNKNRRRSAPTKKNFDNCLDV